MTTHLALLRGINVGRNKQVDMATLRRVLEELGFADVKTHLRSGNVLFTTSRRSAARIAGDIERAIAAQMSVETKVIVRTGDELAATVAANPFPEVEATPQLLHVAFLSGNPAPAKIAALEAEAAAPDRVAPGDGVLYVHYPDGVAASKLSNAVIERHLGVRSTTRNWNTVTKLLALAGA